MLETLPTVNKPIWTTPCLWKKIEWQQYYLGERIYGLPFDSVSQGSKHKSGFPKRTSNTMCMHASTYVYMYICIYTHMYIYIYMCTYVRMYVCMYDIYIYMQALNLSLATAFFSYYFVFLCCFFRYFVLVSCLSFLFSLCVVIWLMRSLSFFLSFFLSCSVSVSFFPSSCVFAFFLSFALPRSTTTEQQQQNKNKRQIPNKRALRIETVRAHDPYTQNTPYSILLT